MTQNATGQKSRSELIKRAGSAILLIPVALGMVWYGGWFLAVGAAVFASLMAWEWWRMGGSPFASSIAVPPALACLALPLDNSWMPAALLAGGTLFNFVAVKGNLRNKAVCAFGVIYVFALSGTMYLLREEVVAGQKLAIYVMVLVWASDIAAFFAGRTFGGPRLNPKESPNKTWSGAIGAVVACMAVGVAFGALESGALWIWCLLGASISIVAQCGDMFESGLKRRFKVKDSSSLLPGHGGIIDRVDGLGAACLFAFLVFSLWPGLADLLNLVARG